MKFYISMWMFMLFEITVVSSLCAQAEFERGYYVSNDNRKVECFIKNSDWKNNPSIFKYRLYETQTPQSASVLDVKEFGIAGQFRYVSAIVEIDTSTDDINEIDENRNPEWKTDTLFLKVIVNGSASLFSYESNKLKRYFYSSGKSPLKQLIYKRHLIPSTRILTENAQFRQQLWNDVKCKTTEINSVKTLAYKLNDLEKYFLNYTKCNGDSSKSEVFAQRKGNLFLWITVGVNYSSISAFSTITTDFGSQVNLRFGTEFEFVLPYNKGRWSVLADPTYQYFYSTTSQGYSIKLNTIEFPVGIRHSIPIGEEKRFFFNVFYVPSFSLNFNSSASLSEFKSPINLTGTKELSQVDNFAIGVGIGLKRVKAEVRYFTERDILDGYGILTVPYNKASLILSYKFF